MNESLRAQIDSNLSHLDGLIRRGRKLGETLTADPSNISALVANRAWQQDCGVAINQLSGGSKAHWLARAFSEAFLLRSASGQVIEAVAPAEIVERLVAFWTKPFFRCHAWAMDWVHRDRLRRRRFPGGSILFTILSCGLSLSRPTPIAGMPLSKEITAWR